MESKQEKQSFQALLARLQAPKLVRLLSRQKQSVTSDKQFGSRRLQHT
jgi:hypothetical protein